jgi:hypothetical protein
VTAHGERPPSLVDFYRDHLKSKALIPDLLAQASIPVPPSRQIRNPNYADTNPSVHVYGDHVTDFGTTDAAGRPLVLDNLAVCREWLGLEVAEAVDLMSRLAGVTPPVRTQVRVQPVRARALPERPVVDPSAHAPLAEQAQAAFHRQESPTAKRALAYLESRALPTAAFIAGVGVIDHTITAPLPHSVWGGLLTFPTWQAGRLLALKGRNTENDKSKRVMRNLTGASVPLYNLENALAVSDRDLWLVEGETDTLTLIEAFEYDAPVAGLPGVHHWRKALGSLDLAGRRLLVALDGDQAGRDATRQILEWATTEGIPALAVDTGEGDKNQQLQALGPAAFRARFQAATRAAVRTRALVVKGALK